MSVPVLLPARFYGFRFLCAPSRLIFRTVLTLLHINFYKSFITIFTFAYIVNAGIHSVFHLVNLQNSYINKRSSCGTLTPGVTVSAASSHRVFIQQKNTFAVCLTSRGVCHPCVIFLIGKSYMETTAKIHRGQLLPLLFSSFCYSYINAACCPPFCSMV